MWRGKLLDGEIMLQTTPRILNTFTGGRPGRISYYTYTNARTIDFPGWPRACAFPPYSVAQAKSLIDLTFVLAIPHRRYKHEIQQIIQSNRHFSKPWYWPTNEWNRSNRRVVNRFRLQNEWLPYTTEWIVRNGLNRYLF